MRKIKILNSRLKDRRLFDGLLPLRPHADKTNRAGDKLFQAGDVLASLDGQLVEAANLGGRRLPAGQFLIDGTAPGQGGNAGREVIDGLPFQLIADTYLEPGQNIQYIQAK